MPGDKGSIGALEAIGLAAVIGTPLS